MSVEPRPGLRSADLEPWLLAAASVGLIVGAAASWSGADAVANAAWLATTVLGILPAVGSVVSTARERRLGADVIALAALVGALAVGEMLAGAIITLMLTGGRAIEGRASARAQRDLAALVGRAPRTVHRQEGTSLVEVPAEVVVPGDLLLVRPGEVLAVDGRVEGGAAVLDESALTGESKQVERVAGDEVRSGAVNAGGPFGMRTTSAAADSTYAAIVRLVEESQASSAPFVRMADRYSGVFIVVGGLVAGLAWALSGDPVRAVAVLVVATPCPLILAAPIAVVAGLSRAARLGVIVKGGAALERLANGDVLLFDKTGTLTSGQPAVVSVHATPDADEREVLRSAASLDQVSPHVLATAVVRAARARGLELSLPSGVEEIPGRGIRGVVDGATIWLGKLSWLGEGIDHRWAASIRRRADRDGRLLVFVRSDDAVIGALTLEDPIRPDAARTMRRLRADGVRRMVMVTGDRDDVARSVAAVVGVDEVLSERSPVEKVDAVRVERRNGSTIMVGDGLNDAAAMATADVGVALGARGSTVASEAADVVVVVDRIDRLGDAMWVARRSQRIARQSVAVGMGLSMAAMLVAGLGLLRPTEGALLQELIDLAVIVNALRALRPDGSGPVELPAEDLALVRRFRTEHASLRPDVDRLVAVADQIGVVEPERALELARGVRRFLVDELLPHEQAEDSELYPALDRAFGGDGTTGTMSRGHAEIAHLTHRLGRVLDDVEDDRLDGDDATDVLRLLYGLHAVLSLHFAQEDESYLSLADT